jgi:hypothetical protein
LVTSSAIGAPVVTPAITPAVICTVSRSIFIRPPEP